MEQESKETNPFKRKCQADSPHVYLRYSISINPGSNVSLQIILLLESKKMLRLLTTPNKMISGKGWLTPSREDATFIKFEDGYIILNKVALNESSFENNLE